MTASGGSQSRRSILIISLEKGWMSDMYQPPLFRYSQKYMAYRS